MQNRKGMPTVSAISHPTWRCTSCRTGWPTSRGDASIPGSPTRRWRDITRRASYYVKLPGGAEVPEGESFLTGKFKFPFFARHHHSSYFFDIYPHLRMMPDGMRFLYMAEDVDWELPAPTFVKSRPVTAGPSMSAICGMNSIRHFRFVEDEVPYEKKKDIVVSRNEVRDQPWRSRLLEMYCGDPRFDFGQINSDVGRPEWVRPFMSIDEQLGHKFIMCIRGNDSCHQSEMGDVVQPR